MKVTMILAVLALAAAAVAPAAHAEIPSLLAWQGVALDSTNVPVTDSTYGFTFRIYDDGVGGNLLWSESQLVTTENGVLNVLLGTTNPIPDSVFAGPDRFLEVQFASEPPYTPRTQIVSVGYAYRVSTLDGASGGTVSTDIDMSSPFDAPQIRFFLEGGIEPVAILGGQPEGGDLMMYDESGNLTAWIYPDFTGNGGGLLIVTDTAGTAGGRLQSDGLGSPEFLVMGTATYMQFYAGTTGDSSVVFPTDAINATEMYDEPGIASSLHANGTVNTGTTAIASASAVFPNSGYAVVICEATFRAQSENNYITAYLYKDGVSQAFWYWDPGDFDSPSPYYDLRQTYVYTGAVSAGATTFELRMRTSAGTADYTTAKVTVMYFPTAYGSVFSPTATTINNEMEQGAVPNTAPVDVEAERQAAIRFNQERIERELAAMKERMMQLENELRSAAEMQPERR